MVINFIFQRQRNHCLDILCDQSLCKEVTNLQNSFPKMVKITQIRVPGPKKKVKAKRGKMGTPKSGSKKILKGKFKKGSIKSFGGPQGKGGDARLKIISRNRSKVVDARDKLVSMARGSDARQKLVKIRNLKEGKVGIVAMVIGYSGKGDVSVGNNPGLSYHTQLNFFP